MKQIYRSIGSPLWTPFDTYWYNKTSEWFLTFPIWQARLAIITVYEDMT